MRNVFARNIETLGRSRIHVQVFRLGERGGRGELHLSPAPGGRRPGRRSLTRTLRERGCGGWNAGHRVASLGMQQGRRHEDARRECDELRNADQTAHVDSSFFEAATV